MANKKRYYIAHHPDMTTAVMRDKTPQELEKWKARNWRIFPGDPEIIDIDDAVRAFMMANVATEPGDEPDVHVLVKEGGEYSVAARPISSPKVPGEVAVIRDRVPIEALRSDWRHPPGLPSMIRHTESKYWGRYQKEWRAALERGCDPRRLEWNGETWEEAEPAQGPAT